MQVKFKKLNDDAVIPKYQTKSASGMDLTASEEIFIPAGSRRIVPTGLAVELEDGYEMQVRPRSGVSIKTDLTVMLGTVDSDYRGEIGIIVHNTGKVFCVVKAGDRIAQGIICPVIQAKIEVVTELSETERGTGAFGSTGK